MILIKHELDTMVTAGLSKDGQTEIRLKNINTDWQVTEGESLLRFVADYVKQSGRRSVDANHVVWLLAPEVCRKQWRSGYLGVRCNRHRFRARCAFSVDVLARPTRRLSKGQSRVLAYAAGSIGDDF